MNEFVSKIDKYFNSVDLVGESFLEDVWIRSNKHYIYFGEKNKLGKTYALFSKKYYMTVELSKDVRIKEILDRIAEYIDIFREEKGIKIKKYQFWLPHCLVNNIEVETKLIAESYGATRELALDYLIHYDNVFGRLYDEKRRQYFGLPLLESYDDAEKFKIRDNTKCYLKGLRHLQKIV